jgi:hypothetical protein
VSRTWRPSACMRSFGLSRLHRPIRPLLLIFYRRIYPR